MPSQLPCEPTRLLFVSYSAVRRGFVSRAEPYLLTCRFYHCGIIDRSGTLDLGFEARILDPLPEGRGRDDPASDFSSLCDLRAQQLLDESVETNRQLDMLWSGGIDSTVALVALLKVCRQRRLENALRVVLSSESMAEYPLFFERFIAERLEYVPITRPLPLTLAPEALIVTGEHGDQLFGSDRLKEFVENGAAYRPWKSALSTLLADASFDRRQTGVVVEYLAPLMQACPRRIETLFDFFWWLNFTLKWQSVTLRIAANVPREREEVHLATRHFFRTCEFQRWSVFHHVRGRLQDWRQYKMPAKQYIYDFTGDAEYRKNKEKERSLRLVFRAQGGEPEEEGADARPILLDERFRRITARKRSA